ncbi:MAG: hypothetical protein O7F70_11340 [Gemmatimonadetes bacterium]|nr:hypothetical protein [Gemmatimonadota bacterium]
MTDPDQGSSSGPNPEAVGKVAAVHLGPLLYALEVCAKAMDDAQREEDSRYYRALAKLLAEAGGTPKASEVEL